MKNIKITLCGSELYEGGMIGVMRRIDSINRGCDKNKHAAKSDWQTDCDGACSEMAFAKYLNVYYGGARCGSFKNTDVAGFQVRSTIYQTGHLIIRDNDKVGSEPFVLVISSAPIFRLVGIIPCGEVKVPKYRRPADDNGGPGWWVPQDDLYDLPEPP